MQEQSGIAQGHFNMQALESNISDIKKSQKDFFSIYRNY